MSTYVRFEYIIRIGGKEMKQKFDQQVNFTIDLETREWLIELAEKEYCSVSAMIRRALRALKREIEGHDGQTNV